METTTVQRFKADKNAVDLQAFCGTENYFRCLSLIFTDGVKFLCESRKCFWLLTDIALTTSYVLQLKSQSFLTCELIKNDNEAILLYTDGNGNVLFQYKYEFTDFEDDGVCLFFNEGVLMLPSEY